MFSEPEKNLKKLGIEENMIVKKNGLIVDKEIDVGDHHYGIIFKVDER